MTELPPERPLDVSWEQDTRDLPPPPVPPPPLCTVGNISVTPTMVTTPNGEVPLAGTTWIVTNRTSTSFVTPGWAIVATVVFFSFCFLGLLFLLVKEQRTTGFVQVSMQRDGFYHATQLPVWALGQVADIEARVAYIRTLAAQAE
jgi:hypothetical protein